MRGTDPARKDRESVMIEKRGGPNFLAELEPKFGFGEAFRIYGIERIYGITEMWLFLSDY